MIKIKEAIVVEGRYDKNTLSQIVDAPILETSGFGIFKDKNVVVIHVETFNHFLLETDNPYFDDAYFSNLKTLLNESYKITPTQEPKAIVLRAFGDLHTFKSAIPTNIISSIYLPYTSSELIILSYESKVGIKIKYPVTSFVS